MTSAIYTTKCTASPELSSHAYRDVLSKIFARHSVKFALLFGSRTTDRCTAMSDVDLAVFLAQNGPFERLTAKCCLMSELSVSLKKEVDLVVLNDAKNNYLLLDILTDGELLYCSDEGFRFAFLVDLRHRVLGYSEHKRRIEEG